MVGDSSFEEEIAELDKFIAAKRANVEELMRNSVPRQIKVVVRGDRPSCHASEERVPAQRTLLGEYRIHRKENHRRLLLQHV